MNKLTTLLAGSLLSVGSVSATAQMDIMGLFDMGGTFSGFGGGMNGDPLGGLIGVPLGSLTFAPIASPELLAPNVINLVVTGAALNPAVPLEIGSGLGLKLLSTMAPGLTVLQESPEAFPTYIFMEGGILTKDSAVALVPAIPLLNMPLLGF